MARRTVSAEPAAGLGGGRLGAHDRRGRGLRRPLDRRPRRAARPQARCPARRLAGRFRGTGVAARPERGRASALAGPRPRGAEGRRGPAADGPGSGHSDPRNAAGCSRPSWNGACPAWPADLQALVDDPSLRGLALRSLAAYDDPATPEVILRAYGECSLAEREDAIATLAARPAWAKALLEALGRGQIPRRDVSVSIARQLQAIRRSSPERAAREGLGQNSADFESQGRSSGQVQNAARLGLAAAGRPRSRAGCFQPHLPGVPPAL